MIYRPPQSKQNYLTKSQFIDEFNEYLEGLAASSGRLLICGDFNINWLDTSDNICKKIQGPHSFSCFELKTFLKTFFTTLTIYYKKFAIFLRKLKIH